MFDICGRGSVGLGPLRLLPFCRRQRSPGFTHPSRSLKTSPRTTLSLTIPLHSRHPLLLYLTQILTPSHVSHCPSTHRTNQERSPCGLYPHPRRLCSPLSLPSKSPLSPVLLWTTWKGKEHSPIPPTGGTSTRQKQSTRCQGREIGTGPQGDGQYLRPFSASVSSHQVR